jgi:2'-5' RNA ligase
LRGAKPVAVRNYLVGAGQFTPLEFEVEGFALFSARNSIGGGPYLMEEFYPFD